MELSRTKSLPRRVLRTRMCFSPDGKQLFCETEAGLRTIYDPRTGTMRKNANMSSVGLCKTMLMTVLHEVSCDGNSLAIKITPIEKAIQVKQGANGWWRAGKDEKFSLKVDGGAFMSLREGVEKKDQIKMQLELKKGTSLVGLVSFDHPLELIEIVRKEMSLEFSLRGRKTEPGQVKLYSQDRWFGQIEPKVNGLQTLSASKAPSPIRTRSKSIIYSEFNLTPASIWCSPVGVG